MKRTPLGRKTPLTAKTGLKRKTALGRSPLARSALHAGSAARTAAPKRRTASPIPAAVRKALARRSGGMCEIAAPGCTGAATEAAHRVKRGMGGRKRASLLAHDVLSNLLHLDHYCHRQLCHSQPALAYAHGWMLRESQDGPAEPVAYRGVWCLLADDGSVSTIDSDATEEAA